MRPRLLDLFCGAGGAAMGYHRAGFDVVGVDIEPQPSYPFAFVQGDALQVAEWAWPWPSGLRFPEGFHAIHASPPCQRWSTRTTNRGEHPDLITPLRPLIEATGLPYVIENVSGAPLDGPILCGSTFGLGVRRHRRFETSWPLMVNPCAHATQHGQFHVYDHGKWYWSRTVPVYGTGGGKGREHWQEAMGIDWTNDTDELREAIPPAYTELIGHQLMSHLQATRPPHDAT